MPRYEALAITATVFLAGALVMLYEFVAVRFLQRNFGGALDVWASEIAVCMAGLAAGYALGGRLADRFASWRPLGLAMLLAALVGPAMEPIADQMGELLLAREPAFWHPLVAALACSFPPLLLLGSVMPQAVRLAVGGRGVARVGSTTGFIAAVSTLGSIAGVLGTAMLLLPRFGVRATLYVASGLLFAWGGVILALARPRRLRQGALVVLGLAAAPGSAEVRFEKYTAHHHVLVADEDGTRTLWFDRTPQTRQSIARPLEGGFEYTDFFHVPLLLHPRLEHALFIGLGGGTGPRRFLHDYAWMRIDAVEIDPVVIGVARDYFGLPDDPRLAVHEADGRVWLRRSRQRFGLIVVDAYGSGPSGAYLPYHLATREFFEIAKRRLEPGGAIAYNLIATSEMQKTLAGVLRTLQEVFGEVLAFRAKSTHNVVLVARLAPGARSEASEGWPRGPFRGDRLDAGSLQALAERLRELGVLRLPGIEERVGQLVTLEPARDVLTDDYAPVDLAPRR